MRLKSFIYLFALAFLAFCAAMAPTDAAAQSAAPTVPGDCPPDTTPNILYQNGFGPGEDPWTSSGTYSTWANVGGYYHATALNGFSDQRLASPPVALPLGQDPIVFKFWHAWDLETDGAGGCYDGAVLQIWKPPWSPSGDWGHLAPTEIGPYVGIITPDFNNPLGDRYGWCGASSSYTIADLSAFAGETVRFRFRLGTDSSWGTPGWDVDDVTVQSCKPANIDVNPLSISSAQAANTATSQSLTVANIGDGTLNWQIAEAPADLPQKTTSSSKEPGDSAIEGADVTAAACDFPADVGWLSVSPANGSNAGSTNTPVALSLDSTGLAAGIYNANLCITSNDPDPGPGNGANLVVVPVELMVEQSCISGRVFVYDTSLPMPNAYTQACSQIGSCVVTQTDVSGHYSVCGLDAGVYNITVFPSPGWNAATGSLGPIILPASTYLSDQDLILVSPMTPPFGTTITKIATGSSGLPIIDWGSDLTLTTHGCAGGTAGYQVMVNGAVVRSGSMAEGLEGVYAAVIPHLYPLHGYATVTITLTCPGGGVTNISFDIYIDPSGHVLTTTGMPIAGATVTLYRADGPGGPFAMVPNGSGIMAPENRTNFDTTDAAGRFGWNVLAGYYTVRAEATGCHAPGNPGQAFVESPVLPIPPPVTDLELRLECPALAVTLAEFVAYPGDGEVLIAWETVAETDLQGFHLWRSLSSNGPTERLNQTMIPAQAPGSSQGASYRYDDPNVEIGLVYWYWLEDVSLAGVATLHGPVGITVSAPTAVTLSGLDTAKNSPSPMSAPVPLAALPATAGLALGVAAWLRRKL